MIFCPGLNLQQTLCLERGSWPFERAMNTPLCVHNCLKKPVQCCLKKKNPVCIHVFANKSRLLILINNSYTLLHTCNCLISMQYYCSISESLLCYCIFNFYTMTSFFDRWFFFEVLTNDYLTVTVTEVMFV